MGLDVALGVVILIAAFRGWLQGFLYQFIRIGGLVACVYLAAPVRDQMKPHVMGYLPSIRADRVDRLLWWVSASVCYIVVVGVATLVMKMTRRPEIPGVAPQRSRNDQFAGFLLGIAKGGLVAAFLVAAFDDYGRKQIQAFPWAEKQAETSRALAWNGQYHPASRIWGSVPVQHFVNHIQRMGLQAPPKPGESGGAEGSEELPVVQTARRNPADDSSKSARRPESKGTPPAPPAPESARSGPAGPGADEASDDIDSAPEAKPKPK